MAEYTKTLGLYKPSVADTQVDVHESLTSNFTKIDDQATSTVKDLKVRPSNFKIPMKTKYRAWQGVMFDGEKIYVFTDRDESFALENIISTYGLDGNLLAEKRNAYTGTDSEGKFMSFGDGNLIDGYLYITAYNINGGGASPYVSRVLKYDVATLTLMNAYDLGTGNAESVTKKDGFYWVTYHDGPYVKKFDLNFNYLGQYALSYDTLPFGSFQGSFWDGDYFYANLHGHNFNSDVSQFAELRKYQFDGTNFNFIEKIEPPTLGCSQGISVYNGFYVWNDRPSNEIVITKSVAKQKTTSLPPKLNEDVVYKPTLANGWAPFDATYDRTARVADIGNGLVALTGMVKPGTLYDGIQGEIVHVFTLPSKLTPRFSINLSVSTNLGPLRASIVGKSSSSLPGQEGKFVVYAPAAGTVTWVSLDGVVFLAY